MKYLNHLADLRCIHTGKVQPNSPGNRAFSVDGSPILCAEDLQDAPVVGCTQIGPGLTPCTTVTTILMGRSQGAGANDMTPLLETLIALTNGAPPGVVKVMSPGANTAHTLDIAPAASSPAAPVPVSAATSPAAIPPGEGTVLHWYEYWLRNQGAAAGAAALNAERVFFLPELDATIPMREGFAAATGWDGYHTAKHGVFERFLNAKGEMVNMSQLFFGEEYRWIRPEYRTSPHQLKPMAEAMCNDLAGKFAPNPQAAVKNLQGMIDSKKFLEDIANLARSRLRDPKSTVWQGRYAKGNKAGLQTNVDFETKGQRFRLAIDPETGQAINFFRLKPELKPQPYYEIVVRWRGNVTDAQAHLSPGSTFRVEMSATWSGILRQGMIAGATSGALAGSFLGAIDGFLQEGIPGALKGLTIGALSGAAVGAGLGALQTLVVRALPWLDGAVTVFGWFATVATVLLDSTATALEPQEFGERYKDDEGNEWATRHVVREGSRLFPKYRTRGVQVRTPGGVLVQFGEEKPRESSYDATPITVYANPDHEVQWQMMRTPEGSILWWWHDRETGEEFVVTYPSDEQMKSGLARAVAERGYRFGGDLRQ